MGRNQHPAAVLPPPTTHLPVLPRVIPCSHSSKSCGLWAVFVHISVRELIRASLGATTRDAVLFCGSGATAGMHKLLGLLGVPRRPVTLPAVGVRCAGYVITVTTYHNAGNFNTTLQGRLVLRAHPPTTANHTRAHTHMHATSLSRRRPVRTSPLRPSIPLLCPLRWSPAPSRGADGRSQTPWTPGCTATAPIGTGIVPRSR